MSRFPFPIPNGWFQVGYSDELAEGKVEGLRYFGRELVLFRDAEGSARLMDAHCPHLGAHLAKGGEVVDGALRCPFHHWKFDGTGQCVEVPYAVRIPARARLGSYPTEERFGCIYAYYDKEGRAPRLELPEVPEYGDEEWSEPYRREFFIESTAQELAENSVDPAHFRYVHRTAALPEGKGWMEGPIFRAEIAYPIGEGAAMQHGSIDIRAHGLGIGVTRFRGIVDTTVLIGGTPIDEENVHQRLAFMVKKRASAAETEGLARVFVAEISRQFEEDMPIWENKVYHERPVLCDGDGPIAEVRRWAQQFY